MKIKNEYVQIKVGNRTYTKQNMILDIYLKRLFEMQYTTDHTNTMINACFLNFSNPIDIQYDSILTSSDFDIVIKNITEYNTYFDKISTLNKNIIKLRYNFDNTSLFYKNDVRKNNKLLDDYYNIPLYGIGFGLYNPEEDFDVYAYIDTRDMNIIINTGEKFSISRVDILQSDGIVKGFDYPLHLVNDSAFYDMRYEGLRDKWVKKAVLSKVYFGTNYGNIQGNEVVPSSTDLDDTSVTYHVSKTKQTGQKMGTNLTLPFTLLPDNSKTIILRYDIYEQLVGDYSQTRTTDECYYMIYKNEDEGNLKIKLSIERGD